MSEESTTTEPETRPEPELHEATVRRAPKIAAFLVIGGLVGAIVALSLAGTEGVAGDDRGIALFVLFVFCIAAGLALGAIVALIADRVSRRRAVAVTVERGAVETVKQEEPAEEASPPTVDAADVDKNPLAKEREQA